MTERRPPHEVDVRAHFGLTSLPFTREIPDAKRWRHPEHEDVIAHLLSSIEARMSSALIAPAGLGKSVVLRALEAQLPSARYRERYLHVADMSKRDFCREICAAVGCESAGYYGALVKRLREHFTAMVDEQSLRPVLLIDEAHDLRPDVLKILRVLTNFEMDSRLVVSIVLSGQTELREMLRRADMQAIRGRIACYTSLRLLTRVETREYIEYQCQLAGAIRSIFEDRAHDAIYESAQGNLRAFNMLALASLQDAAAAEVVGVEHVMSARRRVMP